MPKMFRPATPFYVQFEVTNACNQRCFFCYNQASHRRAKELSTKEAKSVLEQMRTAGVFSINFNGGEPLARPDFFELAEYAQVLGFDIHLNSNATLIDEGKADRIAELFPSVCTSTLGATPKMHDHLVGFDGAHARMKNGVHLLIERGVKVEINVCTFRQNYRDLYAIAKSMACDGVHVFCATRYIMVNLEGQEHLLGASETIKVIETLERIQRDMPTYKEVKLPGPVPYCELPDDYTASLRKWNTPCQIGYGLCRISPSGNITPCPISNDVIGNVREMDFATLWCNERWGRFECFEHLPIGCRDCKDLESCRGGCVGYDDFLHSLGKTPQTRKWARTEAK